MCVERLYNVVFAAQCYSLLQNTGTYTSLKAKIGSQCLSLVCQASDCLKTNPHATQQHLIAEERKKGICAKQKIKNVTHAKNVKYAAMGGTVGGVVGAVVLGIISPRVWP